MSLCYSVRASPCSNLGIGFMMLLFSLVFILLQATRPRSQLRKKLKTEILNDALSVEDCNCAECNRQSLLGYLIQLVVIKDYESAFDAV